MLFVLGTLLLILKLAGAIGWAWWIVLIPFYPIFLIIVVFGMAVTKALFDSGDILKSKGPAKKG